MRKRGIQGLYPLSRNIVSFSVQADQRDEGYQDNDCMSAYLRIAVTSPDKTLVFRHVIAKVVVHLKAGNGVTDDELQRATVTFENLTCTGGEYRFQQWNRKGSDPRHRPHHPQRSDPCRRRIRTHRARPASSPEQVGTEVRENSHRRKDLLLHPRRRRSGLLQWQDVRVPPHRGPRKVSKISTWEKEEVRGIRSSRTVTTKFINKKRNRMKQHHSIFPPAASLTLRPHPDAGGMHVRHTGRTAYRHPDPDARPSPSP